MRSKKLLTSVAAIGVLTFLITWWLGWEHSSRENPAADITSNQVLGTGAQTKTPPPTSQQVRAEARPEADALTDANPIRASPAVPLHDPSDLPVSAVGNPAVRRDTSAMGGASPSFGGTLDGSVRYKLDRDGIREAMRSGLPEIKDCYEQWLKLQPDLGGRLKVNFTIDTDDGVEGRVTSVSLGDAGMGHVAMEGCVLSVVSGLPFEPPLNGSINVTYPFAFGASDSGLPAAPKTGR